MNTREFFKPKTYPPSFKTLFISLFGLFALSGIAWASVEFSSGTRHSGGDNGNSSPGGGSSYGAHGPGTSPNLSNFVPEYLLRNANPANGWGLPSGALRSAPLIHGFGLGEADTISGGHNPDFFHGGGTGTGTSGEGPYNRVSALSENNRPFNIPGNAFPLFGNNGGSGGGGGGGGGKTNPDNTTIIPGGTTNLIAGGTTNPIAGGGQAPTSPAPEPGTYLMMGIGLVMLGFVARSKKFKTMQSPVLAA